MLRKAISMINNVVQAKTTSSLSFAHPVKFDVKGTFALG